MPASLRPAPLDQADGLRRLFPQPQAFFLPVVSNPGVGFGGVMLERLCTAFAEHGRRTLVVDAAERAPDHAEMALLDLAECIEPLSRHVSYLAARGLAIRFVDAGGSTGAFLDAVTEAAPQCDVVLVHAPAADLCRLHARRHALSPVRPLLLSDDRPANVTHAYASLKLLARRGGFLVHDLLLCAPERAPRAERIAMQLATCADDFLGAVLRGWAQVDPASHATDPPSRALRRLVREMLRPDGAEAGSAGLAAGGAAPWADAAAHARSRTTAAARTRA